MIIGELGNLPFRSKQPNGFPDTEAEWLSQEYLVRRIALVNNPAQIGLYKNSFGTFTISDSEPLIDIIRKMVNKNFDKPTELLDVLEKLEKKNKNSNSLIAVLCSRKVLKA